MLIKRIIQGISYQDQRCKFWKTRILRILSSRVIKVPLTVLCFIIAFLLFVNGNYEDAPCFDNRGLIWTPLIDSNLQIVSGPVKPTLDTCTTNTPCKYTDRVDLRVIVIVYNREKSLFRCLEHLQHLELDGDTAALEIWIDRGKDGTYHAASLDAARNFIWSKGTTRVHVQSCHAGIYGQWIDTWRPDADSNEISLILEDDIDISPYAYRWLRAAHAHYGHQTNISGYSLVELDLIRSRNYTDHLALMERPKQVTAFGAARFGTFGFSPQPSRWREFQGWYHEHKNKTGFKPYIEEDVFTNWYRTFERHGTQDGMWTMWFLFFTNQRNLYSVYPNFRNYFNFTENVQILNTSFAYHRRENGLHFKDSEFIRDSSGQLVDSWSDTFLVFPPLTPYYTLKGTLII